MAKIGLEKYVSFVKKDMISFLLKWIFFQETNQFQFCHFDYVEPKLRRHVAIQSLDLLYILRPHLQIKDQEGIGLKFLIKRGHVSM